MAVLKVGDRAPSFALQDESGTVRRLEELVAAGPLVLFFYPKDETAVCTKEACGFRDDYSQFEQHGAQVFGVSRDSMESHASFKSHHGLPFSLLVDPGGKVAHLYGVKKTLGLLPGRTTFVIDGRGIVREVFASALQAQAHVEHALRSVRDL